MVMKPFGFPIVIYFCFDYPISFIIWPLLSGLFICCHSSFPANNFIDHLQHQTSRRTFLLFLYFFIDKFIIHALLDHLQSTEVFSPVREALIPQELSYIQMESPLQILEGIHPSW